MRLHCQGYCWMINFGVSGSVFMFVEMIALFMFLSGQLIVCMMQTLIDLSSIDNLDLFLQIENSKVGWNCQLGYSNCNWSFCRDVIWRQQGGVCFCCKYAYMSMMSFSMHMRGNIFLYNVLGTWQKLSSFLIPLVAIHPVNFLFITATYIMGKYTVQQYHLQIEL